MNDTETKTIVPETEFLREVEKADGEPISSCYQCRKCTNGCPVAFAMDIPPDRIIHMIHLGMKEELLGSNTIWICASCETCSTRCPNEIDIAKTMDTLRQICLREGRKAAEESVVTFHRLFLDSFKKRGRIYEIEMLGRYKMKTGKYTEDLRLGWQMLKKGRLRLLPSRIRGKKEIQQIFERSKERARK